MYALDENILHITGDPNVVFTDEAKKAKHRLFAEREKRVRPGRDEKMLSSWNGWMLEKPAAGEADLQFSICDLRLNFEPQIANLKSQIANSPLISSTPSP